MRAARLAADRKKTSECKVSFAIDFFLNKNVHMFPAQFATYSGCILLGLFWLFLFRFWEKQKTRNFNFQKNAHSLWKRNTDGGGDLRTITPSNRKARRPTRAAALDFRQNFPKERLFCLFQVNSFPFILFILLSGAEWTEYVIPKTE